MLSWALNPSNPYGYYVLLRWVCCAIFAYLALGAHRAGSEGWTWVLGVLALLYNPVASVHLGREIWEPVNIGTIVLVLASVRAQPSQESASPDSSGG
jgi:hypothetical protein